ncbi:FkbM family methyltransferase [Natrialbaceae archaeon A-arb3/5]
MTRIVELYKDGGLSEVIRGITDFGYYRSIKVKDRLRRLPIQLRYRGKTIKRDVNGFQMYLDVSDGGIATDLALDGLREPVATKAYEAQLRRLQKETNETPVIADVGANIGYTVLTAASALDGQVHIYAAEPVPENIEKLRKNIELNGYEEVVTIDQLAIDREVGQRILNLSTHSNLHSFRTDDGTHLKKLETDESIEVETVPLSEWIRTHDFEPSDINALRMDVEGHEADVLASGAEILRADSPLILQIEFHKRLLEPDEVTYLINLLRDSEFEIQACAQNKNQVKADSWEVLNEYTYLQVVATKGF